MLKKDISVIHVLRGYMNNCAYCDIAKSVKLCHKIWENEDFLAFLSPFPNTDGFTILITKQHYSSYIFDLPDDILYKFIIAAKTVAKLLDAKLDDVGQTGIIAEATGVDHAHIKLIPMHGTSNIKKWVPSTAYLETYFKKYKGYLSSHESKRKADNELERIAKKIRFQ